MCNHAPNREGAMRLINTTSGRPGCADPCIAPLVQSLNDAGFETTASCCGHGHRPGIIALKDGRELVIARDWHEARMIDGMFPVDINGDSISERTQGVSDSETE